MDINSDGKLTRQEFVRGCLNDANLLQLLAPGTKSVDKYNQSFITICFQDIISSFYKDDPQFKKSVCYLFVFNKLLFFNHYTKVKTISKDEFHSPDTFIFTGLQSCFNFKCQISRMSYGICRFEQPAVREHEYPRSGEVLVKLR